MAEIKRDETISGGKETGAKIGVTRGIVFGTVERVEALGGGLIARLAEGSCSCYSSLCFVDSHWEGCSGSWGDVVLLPWLVRGCCLEHELGEGLCFVHCPGVQVNQVSIG